MEQLQKQRAAIISVAATSTLTIIKLLVGWWSGSVSVISEGLHSGTDLLAALMAWFAVRQSGKPPDTEHPYGHGKFESLSGAVEAILIWLACFLIAREAIQKLIHGVEVSQPAAALAVMAFSTIVNFVVSTHLFSVARKTESLALEADGWHLRTDAYSSAGVLVGLGVLAITGWHFLDPLLALLVAALIAKAGYDLLIQASKHLLDASLPSSEEKIVANILQRHAQNFINAHHLRTRQAGKQRYIDLHLVVRGDMTVEEAHQLCDEIERDIRKSLPDADITIHVEPESAFEKHSEDEVSHHRFIRRMPKSK
ncbi:MAG: cation diffusion facilitator family transporter [Armatimonadota bacterium]|nr:cation diffusion facilitator family transporter [Armatimonadota bacterium]MDW8141964.1 cation diffusion facilitator family transporter [Armatimonadota bacterium]